MVSEMPETLDFTDPSILLAPPLSIAELTCKYGVSLIIHCFLFQVFLSYRWLESFDCLLHERVKRAEESQITLPIQINFSLCVVALRYGQTGNLGRFLFNFCLFFKGRICGGGTEREGTGSKWALCGQQGVWCGASCHDLRWSQVPNQQRHPSVREFLIHCWGPYLLVACVNVSSIFLNGCIEASGWLSWLRI